MAHSYVVCPVCFANRALDHSGVAGSRLPLGGYEGPVVDTPIIQIREARAGPGRGHREKGMGGFPVMQELSLAEALESPGYEDLALEMKARLVRLVREYVGAGLIDPSELLV